MAGKFHREGLTLIQPIDGPRRGRGDGVVRVDALDGRPVLSEVRIDADA